jgi:OOP family OmpA-OmpF porin
MIKCFPQLVALLLYGAFHQLSAQDSNMIYAEGKIINAETKEPVSARITYQSIPYGNKVGVINNTTYSFPMFDGEKYTIIVEASGYPTTKYTLDPAVANAEKKVIQNIELSNKSTKPDVLHTVGHVMRLNNLIFEVGNSRIDSESFPELDMVVEMLKKNPKMIIQLEGHTDYIGDPRENMKLSQQRVESVKNYMISKGIEKVRLKTKAFGGTLPLSKDDTHEAHRINRRVEVRILAI